MLNFDWSQYRYAHLGQMGLNPDAGLPHLGVNHADEVFLLWNPVYYRNRTLDASDQQMSDILVRAWSSFVKTGVPEVWEIISNNTFKIDLNLKVETTSWPPMSSSNNQYLLLDNVPVLDRSEDYENNMNFWRQLFPC